MSFMKIATPYMFLRLILIGFILAILSGCGNAKRGAYSFPFARAADTNQKEQDSTMTSSSIKLPTDRVNAPEFPAEFAWVNTDRALSIKNDLRGCVVVLDFWTYCCINCMHILPDLEYIEEKYAGKPVVVIGVHSAKFDNESDEQNIGQACQRYNIAHPVIVDQGHKIWSDYTVRAWPTLMVIDPEGKVVGALSGEGNRDVLDQVVAALLEEGARKHTLAATAPEIKRAARVPAASGLAFPGKVLADSAGKYLFISDSNHNQVIIATPGGAVLDIAGKRERGLTDGSFESAQFSNPQGLAFDGKELLYVADTDNHCLRVLNLSTRTVETIAGTGAQIYDRRGGNKGREQGLNSPWDLVLYDGALYIAMAGPHQLWKMDLTSGVCEAWVGSGREDIDDGTGLFAALAQPSGIARKGDWLYFVDSEVSALRRVSLRTQQVQTLIGTGLFDFGYRDGDLETALLQHPLGIAVSGDDILVADTYNHRVRLVKEQEQKIRTVFGSGEAPAIAPASGGTLALYEPGGLATFGDTLYIADTNHDRIVVCNLKSGAWSELKLTGLHSRVAATSMKNAALSSLDLPYREGSDLTLRLRPALPQGYHLNKEAPVNYSIIDEHAAIIAEGMGKPGILPVELTIPAAKLNTARTFSVMLSIAYCTDGNSGLCIPVTLGWTVKLVTASATAEIGELTATVNPLK